ncbi:MAG: branched-chain amino acid ABC transporter permease [Verrucomicrobiota bacterium]
MSLFLQLLANGIVNGALFAVLAVAFGLVYRSARVFHIAFAGLYLVGPYAAYAACAKLGMPIGLAIPVGVIAGGLSGWLAEVVLYRPLLKRNASAAAVMVASLGAFVVVVNLMALGFGNEVRIIERGLAQRVEVGPIGLTTIQICQFLLSGAAVAGLGIATLRLRAFKVIWAMGEEPGLVPVLGLPLHRYRAMVFILSGALGALAGCLIGYDIGIDPHMGMSYLLIAAVAMLAGGIDNYKGWVLGGFSVAILQSLTVWKFSAKWMDLATFTVLIAVLVFRPQGMLGIRKRLEEAD